MDAMRWSRGVQPWRRRLLSTGPFERGRSDSIGDGQRGREDQDQAVSLEAGRYVETARQSRFRVSQRSLYGMGQKGLHADVTGALDQSGGDRQQDHRAVSDL